MAASNQQQQQQESDLTAQSGRAPAPTTGAMGDRNCIQEEPREGEHGSDLNFDTNTQRQIELEEEKKLMARHPCIQRPGSEFLQKRLQRGQKYFDSGDYNMAKASTNSSVRLPESSVPPVTAIDSKVLNKRH